MPQGLGSEFSRLLRASNPNDPRAPWWVNWLLNLAVTGIVIWVLLAAADWVWAKLTGRSLHARCAVADYLASFVPQDLFVSLGLLAVVLGVLLLAGSRTRTAGIVWLVFGALVSSLPELIGFHGWNMGCAASPSA